MLRKNISYTDFNGNKTAEDVYFNLNKAELIDLEVMADKPMSQILEEIGKTPNARDVIGLFKLFIDRAYGIKTADGRHFIKNDDILSDFKSSEVYSELLWKIVSDAKFAVEFIEGLVPADLLQQAMNENPTKAREFAAEKARLKAQIAKKDQDEKDQDEKDQEVPYVRSPEVQAMSDEELEAYLQARRAVAAKPGNPNIAGNA